jgi:putative transposase
MPRKPRMYLPGVPAHVIQRGNNRDACFFADDDYRVYLETLDVGLRRYDLALHAYVLMTNHVHLLLTPSSADGPSRLMQHLGRQYVGYVNKTYRRSGTLWEGRHKASLVEAETYLLACMRYIELNPVAAAMVASPDRYRWSSYGWHALGIPDPLVTDHALYVGLARTAVERQRIYRELVHLTLAKSDVERIRQCLSYNFPLGNDRFRDRIEAALGRKVGECQPGRPWVKGSE